MIILGLDIGRGSAVGFVLNVDDFPVNAKQYFSRNRENILRLASNEQSIEKLLAIAPDAIVLEPTGTWYSGFWARVAKHHHIDVCWVGHADLSAQRKSYGFLNKRDDEDAYCLALCWFDPKFIDIHGNKRFLSFYDCDRVNNIRSSFYDLEQLDKLRTSYVNQLRQRLALEFPEIASRRFYPSKLGFSPAIGWLANLHHYTRIENTYARSISQSLGIEISDYTRAHARAIVELEIRAKKIENWLGLAIAHPDFILYLKVFESFGFGLKLSTLLLIQIYPFEKFLVGSQPWIEREFNLEGKLQTRYRSQRSFQLYLGVGYKWIQSGDKTIRTLGGSSVCRAHLYMWCFD